MTTTLTNGDKTITVWCKFFLGSAQCCECSLAE